MSLNCWMDIKLVGENLRLKLFSSFQHFKSEFDRFFENSIQSVKWDIKRSLNLFSFKPPRVLIKNFDEATNSRVLIFFLNKAALLSPCGDLRFFFIIQTIASDVVNFLRRELLKLPISRIKFKAFYFT